MLFAIFMFFVLSAGLMIGVYYYVRWHITTRTKTYLTDLGYAVFGIEDSTQEFDVKDIFSKTKL
jgi:hypothetical protein